MPFNKSDLIDHVATQTSSTKASTEKFIDALFSSLQKALQEGKEVRLIGFGTFAVKETPARSGRNPRTGDVIQIAGSKKTTFKAGSALKQAVNEGA